MKRCHANSFALLSGKAGFAVPTAMLALVLVCGSLTGCQSADAPLQPDESTPTQSSTTLPNEEPAEKPAPRVELSQEFRRATEAPAATEAEIAAAVNSPEAFLTAEQLVLYNKATDAATLFFNDPPVSFPHYFGRDAWCWDCIPSPAPGKATYYRSPMTWEEFQLEVLQVFTPEFFVWANDALYKPDENGAVLCADVSSCYSGDYETLGYTLLSADENMVRFLEIMRFRDPFPPEGEPAEVVRAVPVTLLYTEAGWRVGEIHLV